MTHGSLFSGIGGFDLGFERAGIRSIWQVEKDDVNRAVLGRRFPDSEQFPDVRSVQGLARVDVISAGFPCQDLSRNGKRIGIDGERSGLAWEAVRIVKEIWPKWLVFENVPGFININNGNDFARFIRTLDECGYVGAWRVLDSAHFGVPQSRRRVFVVAGFGTRPPDSFLSDSFPVDEISCPVGASSEPCPLDWWQGYTISAENARGRLSLGNELLIAHPDRWDSMVERRRASRVHGIPQGLDDIDIRTAYSAGNAVVPQIAEWIARKLAAAEN